MDHVVKLKEVPKGQKLQYIWDYWRIPCIVIMLCIVFFGLLFKTIFFSPYVDMEVLLTCKYNISSEQLENLKVDMKDAYIKDNDDNYKITYVQSNIEIADANPEAYAADVSKLVAEITSATAYVFVVDDDMFEAFKADGLVGTYKELGIESDEDIKVSADKVFKNENFKGKFYFTLRPKDVSQLDNEEDIKKYEYSVDFIKALMENQ